MNNLNKTPHRRFNILTEEWILVSSHRTKRPWQGETEKHNEEKNPEYVSDCYLYPGKKRSAEYRIRIIKTLFYRR